MRFNLFSKNKEEIKEINYSIMGSPFGLALIGSSLGKVCCLCFGDSRSDLILELSKKWPGTKIVEKKEAVHEFICEFLSGKPLTEDIDLILCGSKFQQMVWKELMNINEGELSNYGEIANKLGGKNYSRAVGRAVGLNPIAYIIPCHRVIKSSGEISGYHWGVERKRKMLKNEGSFGMLVGEMN